MGQHTKLKILKIKNKKFNKICGLKIICSPKKTFFWAMRLVHPFIGGQKKYPGRLYTSG